MRGRLRPTGKLTVVLLALVGALLLLASGGRTWLTGTVDDAVLGASRVTATGTEVASGLIALALVAGAAAVASTTSGPVMRRVTLVVLALAGLGEAVVVARVALGPADALGAVAARAAGRTGSLETHATTTAWPWVALVACVLVLVAAACGWVGASRWRGLGARYESPATTAGARGQRVATDWDQLDAGDDPTLHDGPAARGEAGAARDDATARDEGPHT